MTFPIPYRVVHVKKFYDDGGAAKATTRLHRGLRQIGVESYQFVQYAPSDKDAYTYEYQSEKSFYSKIKRCLKKFKLHHRKQLCRKASSSGRTFFSDILSPEGSAPWLQIPDVEIIHLHWFADFFDFRAICENPRNDLFYVWTLHDMNVFTGGCHYALDCSRFHSQCGFCPMLGAKKENDLSRRIWEGKRKRFLSLTDQQIRIVSPSRWLAREAQKSHLLKNFRIDVIPYGIDHDFFCPESKKTARERMGFPQDKKIVLFVADYANATIKGVHCLKEAMRSILASGRKDVVLVTAGKAAVVLPGQSNISLGSVSDPKILKLVYNASDFLVVPSLADNFPNVILEAMACGIPVLGFAAGGIPEMIVDGETGLLAQAQNVSELTRKIEWLLEHPDQTQAMGMRARIRIEELYTLQHQAMNYKKVYADLLSQKHRMKTAP